MDDPIQRPASSWPASLLPALMLLALLSGGAATTAAADSKADSAPVVEMTVEAP